jgi:hypothetical protein
MFKSKEIKEKRIRFYKVMAVNLGFNKDKGKQNTIMFEEVSEEVLIWIE